MRTTLVILISDFRRAIWAHAGDSRLYWLKKGSIWIQTKDHSVPQRLCDAGEITPDEIRFHEDHSRLLRSLGARTEIRPSLSGEPQAVSPV